MPHVIRRRGTSLIEMLVYVSCAGLVTTLIAVTLQVTFRTQRLADNASAEQVNLHVLAQQVRDDVHRASEIVVNNGKAELKSTSATVLYTNDDHYIVREAIYHRGEGSQIQRYPFPPRNAVRWATEEHLVTLSLKDPTRENQPPWRVQAQLAADRIHGWIPVSTDEPQEATP